MAAAATKAYRGKALCAAWQLLAAGATAAGHGIGFARITAAADIKAVRGEALRAA